MALDLDESHAAVDVKFRRHTSAKKLRSGPKVGGERMEKEVSAFKTASLSTWKTTCVPVNQQRTALTTASISLT
jgi:hypothetical protein